MDTNKMRDDLLEQAFSRLGDDKGQGLHPYFKDAFRRGWEEAWRLSREAVVVELPPVRPEPVSTGDALKADGESATWNMWAGEKLAKEDCREAIKAQGLKVKP